MKLSQQIICNHLVGAYSEAEGRQVDRSDSEGTRSRMLRSCSSAKTFLFDIQRWQITIDGNRPDRYDRLLFGRSGRWRFNPAASTMNWLPDVGQEITPNGISDCLSGRKRHQPIICDGGGLAESKTKQVFRIDYCYLPDKRSRTGWARSPRAKLPRRLYQE